MMNEIVTHIEKATTDAIKILKANLDSEGQASIHIERTNAEIARLIYDMRKSANLNQRELAKLIGTTQSVISRLENTDYTGHSLSMLSRIAEALGYELSINVKDKSICDKCDGNGNIVVTIGAPMPMPKKSMRCDRCRGTGQKGQNNDYLE